MDLGLGGELTENVRRIPSVGLEYSVTQTSQDDARRQLAIAVGRARAQVTRRRQLRVVAGAAGASAVAVGLGAPPWIAAVVPIAAVATWLWRPHPLEMVRRIDVALSSADEIACAWDHRDGSTPLELLQRRRAASRLVRGVPDVARRPSPVWAVGPLLWLWPVLTVPPSVSPAGAEAVDRESSEVQGGPRARGMDADDGARPSSPERTESDETSASAEARAPDKSDEPSSPDADEERPANRDGVSAEQAGIGGKAGDRKADGPRRRDVEVGEGLGAEIEIARSAGVETPSGDARLAAPTAVTAPPPIPQRAADQVADPARPYPTRYQALITAWFDRRRRP